MAEERIKRHAKTPLEIETYIQAWRRTFQSGAKGNHKAYAEARDTRHFIEEDKWIPEKDVLQILADYVVISREEGIVQLIEKIAVEELEKKNKIIPLKEWRELLKLWKSQPKLEDYTLKDYSGIAGVANLLGKLKHDYREWVEKIEGKLEELQPT